MKKMRRLIPAFAMLMVAAIMLSTASFAWFTMNDEVTATGMEIKAKADSSLLISQAPLTADGDTAGAPDVKIDTGVQNLYPMAYAPGQKTDENGDLVVGTDGHTPVYNTVTGATLSGHQVAGWYIPSDNSNNNIQTGLNGSTFDRLTEQNFLDTDYFYTEEFYLATVDEAKTNATLELDLSALSADGDNETWKAYAAAIYVVEETTTNEDGKTVDNAIWVDGADVPYGTVPNAIIFADDASDDNQPRGIVNLPGLNIPSVAGAIDGNTVGLKIIVHFYVDGALMSKTTTPVTHGSVYTQANAAYDATKSYIVVDAKAVDAKEVEAGVTDVSEYYTRTGSEGAYVYTPANGPAVAGETYYEVSTSQAVADDKIINDTKVPANWCTAAVNTIRVPYTYVRTADIPSTGTELELSFKLAS